MKQRLITTAAGLIALVAAVVWVAQASEPRVSVAADAEVVANPSPVASSSAEPAAEEALPDPAVAADELVSYAIPVAELQGLPPDLAPGTAIDLWVMWQPPVTKNTKVHRLLRGILLEKIVPPLLRDAPHVAVLLVSPDQLSDLVWADRLGTLSAAVPAAPER